jgi:hypothetical protein
VYNLVIRDSDISAMTAGGLFPRVDYESLEFGIYDNL